MGAILVGSITGESHGVKEPAEERRGKSETADAHRGFRNR
jgi:hypothetical protein